MKKISRVIRDQVLELLRSNKSMKKIVKDVGVSIATVSRIKSSYLPSKANQLSGRPSLISKTALRSINRKALIGRFKTGKDVHRHLLQEGVQISYQSTLDSLRRIKIRPRKKSKKPYLSDIHKRARYKWAKVHKDWTVNDWAKVIFSDETRINLWTSDGIQYCLRKEGTTLQPFHVQETVKYGGGHLMFWGCMTYRGLGYGSKIYDGNMKAEDYLHILKTSLKDTLKHYRYSTNSFIFQHDNDRKHTAKGTKNYLFNQGIEVLPWPSNSPDLNPIEYVWRYLKVKIGSRENKPKNIDELWELVLQEWEKIPADYIKSLYESMPSRVQAVLEAKGGHTKY
jgi:transposase